MECGEDTIMSLPSGSDQTKGLELLVAAQFSYSIFPTSKIPTKKMPTNNSPMNNSPTPLFLLLKFFLLEIPT